MKKIFLMLFGCSTKIGRRDCIPMKSIPLLDKENFLRRNYEAIGTIKTLKEKASQIGLLFLLLMLINFYQPVR